VNISVVVLRLKPGLWFLAIEKEMGFVGEFISEAMR